MEKRAQRIRGLFALLAGVVLIALYWSVGAHQFQGYRLGVGSVSVPRRGMIYFVAFWTFFGSAAALLIAIGSALLFDASFEPDRILPSSSELPRDRTLILAASGLALLAPVLLRVLLLDGAPMTDDESAYRFMAELLASGRVAAESPPAPLRLFFDRFQMINDGSRYAQYFLGWPALLAPGVWLGVEEWMNALYAALAVPPLYLLGRRLGERWTAVVTVLLYVTSPFLMTAAATLGAHTSCFTALAWTYWAFFRTRAESETVRDHALFAAFFSVAFFVRPLAALGLGGPLVVSWLWRRLQSPAGARWGRIAAFALPAGCFAALFFAVNYAQTGSPWSVAYVEFLEYARANGGRFVGIPVDGRSTIPNLAFSDVTRAASVVATGLFRFDAALFGWPISLIFVAFAGLDRRARMLWASAAGYLATRLLLKDPGIDLFGPVHFLELALPAILLTALGLRRLVDALRPGEGSSSVGESAVAPLAAVALCASSLILAAGCYLPVRLGALGRVADNTKRIREAVRTVELEDAVVFAPRPFIPNCLGEGARHFVFWRPLNAPDLDEEVLWVNHVTLEDDREFMKYAPGRRGYLLAWKKPCEPRLIPLEHREASRVPDGHIGGTGRGPDWSRAPEPDAYSLPKPPQ